MQLGLKVDKFQILRCYGRYANAAIAEETKYPKLLPRRVHFTSLIIIKVHQRLIHAGNLIHWDKFVKRIGYHKDELKLDEYYHNVWYVNAMVGHHLVYQICHHGLEKEFQNQNPSST